MNNYNIERLINLRIKRVKQRVDSVKHYNSDEHTFHGGWTQGYWDGQLSVLEDLQDILEDMRAEEERMKDEQDKLRQKLIDTQMKQQERL